MTQNTGKTTHLMSAEQRLLLASIAECEQDFCPDHDHDSEGQHVFYAEDVMDLLDHIAWQEATA